MPDLSWIRIEAQVSFLTVIDLSVHNWLHRGVNYCMILYVEKHEAYCVNCLNTNCTCAKYANIENVMLILRIICVKDRCAYFALGSILNDYVKVI